MTSIIVSNPDRMVKMRILTVRDRLDETLKTLHRIGMLHVEESAELKHVDKKVIEKEGRQVSELLNNINSVLSYLPDREKISPGEDVEVIYTRFYEETEETVKTLCIKLGNMRQRIIQLENRVEELTELERYIQPLQQQTNLQVKDLSFSGTYLYSCVYVLPTELYEALPDKLNPHIFGFSVFEAQNETIFHLVARIVNKQNIETIIKDSGGKALQIPDRDQTIEKFLADCKIEANNLQNELIKLHTEISSETKKNLRELVLFREALFAENEKLLVLQKSSEAKYVNLIEGWVPKHDVEFATAELREKIGYIFVDTRPPGKNETPPTKMNNPAVLKPFQIIVSLFGTPRYDEWDPTPIVAYSFALFFGIMLGDVVYALCLIALTKFALPRMVGDIESEGTKLFQRILYISSGTSLLIGLLTGTYLGDFYRFFGIESLALSATISALFSNTLLFIVFSLAIGLIHVNIGHIIAFIKGIKSGLKHIVLEKIGLFLLQLAGIPWIMHFLDMEVLTLNSRTYAVLPYAMLISIVLIVISSVIKRGAFMGGIFWLFEITGILGDVMSYARLAGVGLATYYLAFCFNLMGPLLADLLPVGIIRTVLGTLVIIVVLLIGHIINLVLSSLTCFVHSLRLCFVEFLFKFFEGGGREYSPFRLKKRELILVKENR